MTLNTPNPAYVAAHICNAWNFWSEVLGDHITLLERLLSVSSMPAEGVDRSVGGSKFWEKMLPTST